MARRGLTHADFLATLVADGCVPMGRGQLPAKMPIEARVLDAAERSAMGAPEGAVLVSYPVGKSGVFLQMSGSRAIAWYDGVNCSGAVDVLDKALRRAHPTTTLVKDGPHPDQPSMSVRIYKITLDASHHLDVEATYPAGPHIQQQFVVRVHAWERR